MDQHRQLKHEDIKNQKMVFPISIVCDNIRTPENIGMIFRLAEAFGAECIYLCGDAPTLPNKKVARAARSTIKPGNHRTVKNTVDIISELKNKNYTIIGLEVTNNRKDIRHFHFYKNNKIALVLGSERYGISKEVLQMTDHCVHINLFGNNTSINVANATAIALYEMAHRMGLHTD